MKRATITLTDDLDAALDAYARDQDVSPALTAVVQTALRGYLMERGYLATGPLRITPADSGSGAADVSINHDRYFGQK